MVLGLWQTQHVHDERVELGLRHGAHGAVHGAVHGLSRLGHRTDVVFLLEEHHGSQLQKQINST